MTHPTVQRLMVMLLLIAFLASALLTVQAFAITRTVQADGVCWKHIRQCDTCGFCKQEYWFYKCDQNCDHCQLLSHECYNYVQCCAQ